MSEDEHVIASYREIAERFGLGSADAARVKVRRAQWERQPPNHPLDPALIRVPKTVWDQAADLTRAKPPSPPLSEADAPRSAKLKQRGLVNLSAIQTRSDLLEGELIGVRQALAEARARSEAEAKRADTEASRAAGAEARAAMAEAGIRRMEERVIRLEAELAAERAPLLERLGRSVRGFLDALKGK